MLYVMLFWIIKQVVISLVLIVLVHYIYVFFKDNLTVPKIKDLVNRPTKQYEEMYKALAKPKDEPKSNSQDTTKQNMKDELQSYLHELSSDTSERTVKTANAFSPSPFSSKVDYNCEVV